jgi:hypothetical protein
MKSSVCNAASIGVIACGGFVVWAAAASSWGEPAITEAVGWSGIAGLCLAVLAMVRRSWARLPLLGACVISGLLIDAGFFTEYDPSAMTLLGHFFLGILLTVAGSIASVVNLLDALTRDSRALTR